MITFCFSAVPTKGSLISNLHFAGNQCRWISWWSNNRFTSFWLTLKITFRNLHLCVHKVNISAYESSLPTDRKAVYLKGVSGSNPMGTDTSGLQMVTVIKCNAFQLKAVRRLWPEMGRSRGIAKSSGDPTDLKPMAKTADIILVLLPASLSKPRNGTISWNCPNKAWEIHETQNYGPNGPNGAHMVFTDLLLSPVFVRIPLQLAVNLNLAVHHITLCISLGLPSLDPCSLYPYPKICVWRANAAAAASERALGMESATLSALPSQMLPPSYSGISTTNIRLLGFSQSGVSNGDYLLTHVLLSSVILLQDWRSHRSHSNWNWVRRRSVLPLSRVGIHCL